MKRILTLSLAIGAAACASNAPQSTPTPAAAVVAPAKPVVAGLTVYAGTYTLQGPSRQIQLRVTLEQDGKLHGELVGTPNQTIFRESGEPHKFLHATSDEVWFLFTVENGRATAVTMHQGDREISGARTQ